METKKNSLLMAMVIAAVFGVLLQTSPVLGQSSSGYSCLPSCNSTDGRFLSIAGSGYQTVVAQPISISFSLPSTATMLEFDIFDGNSGGMWESGGVPLRYTVYPDANNDGVPDQGQPYLAQWSNLSMTDNAWKTFSFPVDPLAQAPSGNYFFLLIVENTKKEVVGISNFKIRSTASLSLTGAKAFSFLVPLFKTSEAKVLYPFYPGLSVTTYDGTFNFHPYFMSSQAAVSIWDGDLDFGSYDCSLNDTADSDTPKAPWIPPWSVGTDAVPEGEATGTFLCNSASGGQVYSSGDPPDDYIREAFRRTPNIRYDVVDPYGRSFENNDPSGNREWEQFKIDSQPGNVADHYVGDRMPGGLYHVQMEGVDLTNLNAWRFSVPILGVCDDSGDPCKPILHPYLIGDTVFNDLNGNGIQEWFEPGIPGVVVELLDSYGNPIQDQFNNPVTTETDGSGKYFFEVDGYIFDNDLNMVINNGTYTVRVASSNFQGMGRLVGYRPTVDYTGDGKGDNNRTYTIGNANGSSNFFEYDFGYIALSGAPVTIGDTVWYDMNKNGVQDADELGINGVILNLYDDKGKLLSTTTTNTHLNVAGWYSFSVPAYFQYTVQVSPENFLQGGALYGMVPTVDYTNDYVGDNQRTQWVLNTTLLTFDFGYYMYNRGAEGCTPGYWKQTQHFDSWVGYLPSDDFNTAFGVGPHITLLQALGTGGGGEKALLRHAAAALLNAASYSAVDYYYQLSEVISIVQSAYLTLDFERAKNLLAARNEASCPLN